jgi:hypothetical protein
MALYYSHPVGTEKQLGRQAYLELSMQEEKASDIFQREQSNGSLNLR